MKTFSKLRNFVTEEIKPISSKEFVKINRSMRERKTKIQCI